MIKRPFPISNTNGVVIKSTNRASQIFMMLHSNDESAHTDLLRLTTRHFWFGIVVEIPMFNSRINFFASTVVSTLGLSHPFSKIDTSSDDINNSGSTSFQIVPSVEHSDNGFRIFAYAASPSHLHFSPQPVLTYAHSSILCDLSSWMNLGENYLEILSTFLLPLLCQSCSGQYWIQVDSSVCNFFMNIFLNARRNNWLPS